MSKFTNIQIVQLRCPEELPRSLAVRYEVFTLEQGYPRELDFDGADALCQHWVATSDVENEDGTVEHNVDIGCIRLIPKSDGVAKLGRLAVKKSARGHSVGIKLVDTFVNYCKNNGFHTIVLHSQYPRRGFYERAGFVIEKGDDEIFDEAGTPHVRLWMRNL